MARQRRREPPPTSRWRRSREMRRVHKSFQVGQEDVDGSWVIPSGYVKIDIENGHRNSEFSH